MIVEKYEIKKVSLSYCQKVLQKNYPDDTMKELAASRDYLNKQRMEEDITRGFSSDKDTFNEVVEKFKSNNKQNYDLQVKASEDYKDAVFMMCQRFFKERDLSKEVSRNYTAPDLEKEAWNKEGRPLCQQIYTL